MEKQYDMRAERIRRRTKEDLFKSIVKLLNVLLVTLPFSICWIGFYSKSVVLSASLYRNAGAIGVFALLYVFFGRVYDAFYLSIKRISEMLYSQALSILMADTLLVFMIWLMSEGLPRLLPTLIMLGFQLLLSFCWCYCAHQWYFSHFDGKKSCIVYDLRREMESLFGEYGLDKKFDVRFTCSVEECLAGNMECLNGLDSVFLCGVHSHERNTILKRCVEQGIETYMIPRIGDVIMSGAKRMHMFHLPILRVGRYNPPIEYAIIKRLADIVVSSIGIIIASPIMAAVAVAIKAFDGGPVFYKQTRLTKDGRQFQIWKFRSMKTNAEQDGIARLSSGEKDDRVTPVGRFIRACRLDELPQLFNILGGSMSLVGPRPERPEIAAQYERQMPEFRLRLQTKAGLTGYAQVYGKYNTLPYDKLLMDLMYFANPSLLEDIRILFATVQVLFTKESTEGVVADQATAEAGADETRSA